mgnify:CR=1 FL=1
MATTTSSGTDIRVFNFSVTTDGIPITINDKSINSFVIQCRTAVDMYLRESGGAGDYFTIKAGAAFTLDIRANDFTPFHLTSASGTVVAEVIGHVA